MNNKMTGKIIAVRGVVVDIEFSEYIPKIYEAITINLNNGKKLTLEVQAVIGDKTVRTVALGATYGLRRGMEVVASGNFITVPVGEATLGRLFNTLG